MRKTSFSSGFLLIDLVTALAVVSVLLMAVVPLTWQSAGRAGLAEAAAVICSDVRLGEQKALSQECASYRIQFIPAMEAYRTYFDQGNPQTYEIKRMPDGVNLESTNLSGHLLRFNARGTVVQGGTVSLRDNHGHWKYVVIQPITGRVVVRDGP